MRHWTAEMERADALLFGRVTYEMMEAAWRKPATGVWPDWMSEWEIPFAEAIHRAKKYVVSTTLASVDWNAELLQGDLAQTVGQLKQESGHGLWVGGVTLPLALADLGLIDEYEFLVQPVLAGHGPTLLAGLRERIPLELIDRREFRSGAVALRYRNSSASLTSESGPESAELVRQPIGYWTGEAHRRIGDALRAAISGESLSQPQWWMLNRLDSTDGMAEGELLSRLEPFNAQESNRDLAADLADLRGRGLIDGPPDGLLLTDPGREALQKARETMGGAHRAMTAGLSDDEYATAIRVLRQIVANLGGDPTV